MREYRNGFDRIFQVSMCFLVVGFLTTSFVRAEDNTSLTQRKLTGLRAELQQKKAECLEKRRQRREARAKREAEKEKSKLETVK